MKNLDQNKNDIAVIILAAGKGSRMKSDIPKVLHKIAGQPMVEHIIGRAKRLKPKHVVGVIARDMPEVEEIFSDHLTAYQDEQLGTGHALRCGVEALPSDFTGTILMMYGDHPLVRLNSFEAMIERHSEDDKPAVTILAFEPDNLTGYGRLILENDYVDRIVEDRDTNTEEAKVRLCNGAAMCFDGAGLRSWLSQLKTNNDQGEYYATDIPALAKKEGRLASYIVGTTEEMQGVNTQEQLAIVEAVYQKNNKRAQRA